MKPIPSWLVALVRLSRREYFADFFVTPPITAALALISLHHGFGPRWCALFAAGWLVWTLYEYGVHRVSHHAPWLRDLHALHHRNVKDYIGLHPALTLAFYAATWLIFGFNAAPFAVGFSVGYVAYAGLHTVFHYGRDRLPRDGRLWRLYEHHVAHHREHECCFGVTTTLWDRVFGTVLPSKPAQAYPIIAVMVLQPVPTSLRSRFGRYVFAVLIGIDVLTNALLGGVEYQTISCRIGESMRDGGWAAHVPWPAWWRAHCAASIYQTVV